MRRFEKAVLCGAGYTVLILLLFYLFAVIMQFENISISFPRFLVIFTFGYVIAAADMIYGLTSIKRIFKCLIHYTVLLIAFITVFVAGEFISANSTAEVFVAITVYTVLYFSIFGIIYLIRRTVVVADDRLEKRIAAKETAKPKDRKNQYTPKFK